MSRTDGGEYLCVVKSNLGNYSITAFKLDVHCEYYGICIGHFHHYIFCIVLKNSNWTVAILMPFLHPSQLFLESKRIFSFNKTKTLLWIVLIDRRVPL